jgi:hypothetical protein
MFSGMTGLQQHIGQFVYRTCKYITKRRYVHAVMEAELQVEHASIDYELRTGGRTL